MDVSEYMEGLYLTMDEVINAENKTALILGNATEEESKFGGKRVRIEINFNGKLKYWTLNRKTISNLVEKFGRDTMKWQGQEVKFRIIKNSNGQMGLIGYPKNAPETEIDLIRGI